MLKDILKERFAYIEHMVRWYGGVTASLLSDAFGIERSNAQEVISKYEKLHPDALKYDSSLKRKVALEEFDAQYLKPEASLFLGGMRGGKLVSLYRETSNWEEIPLIDVDAITRIKLENEVVKTVVNALLKSQVLWIRYQATSGESERMLSPNHLVYADFRYHLRGYCHLRKNYRDFVLGRIIEAKTVTENSDPYNPVIWRSGQNDQDWNQKIELRYRINPKLEPELQKALILDYVLQDEKVLVFNCRKALAPYLEYRFQLTDSRLGQPRWVKVT